MVFTVAGVGGALIGYQSWKAGDRNREKERLALKQKQQAQLDQINKERAMKRGEPAQQNKASSGVVITNLEASSTPGPSVTGLNSHARG
jgi:hypothetical protein